ncbi:WXG100 family type VII secretion target [Kineosporia sp. A_224]|uniref:WXG100 family type VII secretion target n=1 Tax=Kineosporia sp. A_224 TaxID=1962180 RepID=UPI00130433BE|nr:type VII secretion target [Kineosporia sp. A_224]
MAGFAVDAEVLAALAGQMTQIAEDLSAAATRGHDVVPGSLGGHEVEDALHTFQDHWQTARGDLVQRLTSLATLLHDAAEGYATVDQQVGSAARPGAEP